MKCIVLVRNRNISVLIRNNRVVFQAGRVKSHLTTLDLTSQWSSRGRWGILVTTPGLTIIHPEEALVVPGKVDPMNVAGDIFIEGVLRGGIITTRDFPHIMITMEWEEIFLLGKVIIEVDHPWAINIEGGHT